MTAELVAMSASETIGTLLVVVGMFFIYHALWGGKR